MAPNLNALARLRMAQDKNPLYNPLDVLHGHDLANAAGAVADIALKPKLNALDNQSRSERIQGGALAGRAGDYYKQMAQDEAGRLANFTATRQAASGGIQQATQTAQGQLTGDANNPERIAAQNRIAAQGQLQQGASNAQGTRTSDYFQQLSQARALHGGEVQDRLSNQLSNRLHDLADKRTSLESQRGDLTLDALTKLRASGFDNSIALKTLGLKAADLQSGAQIAQAKLDAQNKQNGIQNQLGRDRLNATLSIAQQSHNDRVLGILTRPGQKGPKPTPLSARDSNLRRQFGTGLTQTINHLSGGYDHASMRNYLKGQNTPDILIQAMFEVQNSGSRTGVGSINPNTYKQLKLQGYNLPRSGYAVPTLKRVGSGRT